MDNISIAIIGYISGALAGGFITLIALIYAYIYINDKTIEELEYASGIYNFLLIYYEGNTIIFSMSFAFGFLSALGIFASSSKN